MAIIDVIAKIVVSVQFSRAFNRQTIDDA